MAYPCRAHENEADAYRAAIQTGCKNLERTTALFRQRETSFPIHQDGNPAPLRCNRAQRPAPHGFRSIASTLLNELGYNRDWIERQLAHGERNDVRAAYNYAEYLPERRRMMQEWADYLTELKSK